MPPFPRTETTRYPPIRAPRDSSAKRSSPRPQDSHTGAEPPEGAPFVRPKTPSSRGCARPGRLRRGRLGRSLCSVDVSRIELGLENEPGATRVRGEEVHEDVEVVGRVAIR